MPSRAPAFTRGDLDRMKRIEIQKLCKDYGVKANLKTEALIELLLDTVHNTNLQPLAAERPQPAPPRRTSARSRVTSQALSRTRGFSGNSVIIHDDDGLQESSKQAEATPQPDDSVAAEQPALSSRQRKANETQRRLGVGRPIAAGGNGARAITKSLSLGKGRRGKSRSVKPVEDTIEEEQEQEPIPAAPTANNCEVVITTPPPVVSCSQRHYPPPTPSPNASQTKVGPSNIVQSLAKQNSSETVDINNLKQTLLEQSDEIDGLKTQIHALQTEVAALQTRMSSISRLESSTLALENTMAQLMNRHGSDERSRHSSQPTDKSPTKGQLSRRISIPLGNSDINSSTQPTVSSIPAAPGLAAPILGKRSRDSTSSNVIGMVEALSDEQRTSRPDKKRAKVGKEGGLQQTDQPEAGPSGVLSRNCSDGTAATSGDGNLRTPVGTPPPTTYLHDLFDDRFMAGTGDENAHLNFSFSAPTTSTPMAPHHMPSFSGMPHVPFSPGSALEVSKADGFGTRRVSSTSRTRTPGVERYDEPYLYPGALARSPLPADTESGPFGARLTVAPVERLDDSPAPPMKKTMYGTELADDTRFGDFGRDGIASGSNNFWLGGRYM